MKIIVTNLDTNQYIRTISEEEFIVLCGKDKRMVEDYLNRLRKNPIVKQLNEIWTIEEDNKYFNDKYINTKYINNKLL